jgi:hypothetical protein
LDYAVYQPYVITALPPAVPTVDSAANSTEADVVGNKNDDENGSSLASKTFRSDKHQHSAAKVYPTLAAGATVTKSATPWTLGAFAVVVPTNTIAEEFDIHGINFDSVPDNGTFELVLYAGPNGSEVEIGRVSFTRVSASSTEFEVPFMCPLNSPNAQIKAKLAGSNSQATAAVLSIRYHVY